MLIALILTIVSDIIFFRWLLAGADLPTIIANVVVFIVPITALFSTIYSWIFDKIENAFGIDLSPKVDPDYVPRIYDRATINRADGLLKIANAIEASDLELKYDLNFIHYKTNLKIINRCDSVRLGACCLGFEEWLITNSDAVAMTDAGYRWLMTRR